MLSLVELLCDQATLGNVLVPTENEYVPYVDQANHWPYYQEQLYDAVLARDVEQVALLCRQASIGDVFVPTEDGYVPYVDQPNHWPYYEDSHLTPLFFAVGQPEVMRVLLRYGADPNIQNIRGETVFDLLVSRIYMDVGWSTWDDSLDLECLEILISFGFRATLSNLREGLALMDCPVPVVSWRDRLDRVLDCLIPCYQVQCLYDICLKKVRS